MTIDEAIEQAATKKGWNNYAQVLKYVANVQGSEKTIELILKDAMVIYANAAVDKYQDQILVLLKTRIEKEDKNDSQS